MVKAKVFIYANHFQGPPKPSDFELLEEELPAINDGEFLAKALYLSVDPYMRPYMKRFPIRSTMIGGQVAEVIESKNPDFPVGSKVFGYFGWRDYTIWSANQLSVNTMGKTYVLPDFGDLPYSLGVGYLGMPGNTAYFGLLELCQPKSGETVVVTAAAGAVGSLVGQIAKIKGCRVIGFAGTDDKCKWLENELGFDKAINYKVGDMAEELKKAAPNGVDCYFDNVGGELSSTIINQMNEFGRISVCGSISSYNDQQIMVPSMQTPFIWKQLKMEGFIVNRWQNRWMEGINQILTWMKEGKIKYNETVTEGFENQPKAFMEMLAGKNLGKAIVKA